MFVCIYIRMEAHLIDGVIIYGSNVVNRLSLRPVA